MKRFGWGLLVAGSMMLAVGAGAETRPQYGGTVRVAMREAPASLDPGDGAGADSLARRNLLSLIFETLVTVDDRGRVRPGLAVDWEAAPGNQRWQFQIRRGVKFHDGSVLTAEIAASSLRTANPLWKVLAEGEFVIVQCDHADAHLPAELALTRNSIVKKNSGGQLSGTGPFHIQDWQAEKKLVLRAGEDYWSGRPFIDEVDVEMGRNVREQAVELELGKADLVEVAPEQAHRDAAEKRTRGSQPVELVALVFHGEALTADEKLMRSALALSIERSSMRSVLLQGAGQTAGSLLPNWMSGYGFTFSSDADLKQARHEREQAHAAPNWTVGYDANDSLARLVVERVALNAKDAGISLRPTTAPVADLRLVRLTLASADPWVGLATATETLEMAMPKAMGDSVEDLYNIERALLASHRVVPLFHLPVQYAASPMMHDWRPAADGRWRLDESWMGKDKP
jgi:peptide/nickel transport system substrate-binding protein